MEEIQQINKDDFWVKAQRDEEERRQQENQRAELQRKQLEEERMEMEERQAEERERQDRRRAQQIQQDRIQQQQREEEERRKEEQQRQNQVETSKKVTGINSAASVQKANEAKSLISQRSFNPRDIFKQKEQSFEANGRSPPAASRPGKLQSPFLSQRSFERESPVQPQDHLTSAPAVTPMTPLSPVSPVSPVSPELPDSPAAPGEPTRSPDITDSSVQPADAVYTEEEEWSDEFDDDEATPEQTSVQEDLYEAPQSADVDEDLYEDVYQQTPAVEDVHVEAAGQGVCARALYDYQAADDTEITFDPDDIITQIDMLDEGWWRGYGPDGHYGMFPANYVELL